MKVRCVGAVVLDDAGRLLVVRRAHAPSAGLWSVPGGRVEPGEDALAAVVREVREETGLVVTVGPRLGTVDVPAHDAGGTVYEVEDYRCSVAAGDVAAVPVAGDDAAEARWVTRRELEALDLVPGLHHALNGWSALPR